MFAKECHHLQNLLFVRTLFYLPVLRVAFKISNTEKRSSEFLYFSRLFLRRYLYKYIQRVFPILYRFFFHIAAAENKGFILEKVLFLNSYGETGTDKVCK